MVDIRGTNGPDQLVGGMDDDWFHDLGDGADFIDGGGAGWDGMSYEDDGGSRGVVATWNRDGSGTVTDTFGNTDSFVGLRGIKGSSFADTMTVEAGADILIDGSFGSDTYSIGDPQWVTLTYGWLYNQDDPMGSRPDFFGVHAKLGEGTALAIMCMVANWNEIAKIDKQIAKLKQEDAADRAMAEVWAEDHMYGSD